MRRGVGFVTIVLAGLILSACSVTVTPSASPLPTLTGTFVLSSSERMAAGPNGTCRGSGGYSDIVPGMPVTVKDQAGTIIATGAANFDGSAPTATWTASLGVVNLCDLKFEIDNLPVATFYSIEVGHRGALSFSAADLAAAGWHVDFTLGT